MVPHNYWMVECILQQKARLTKQPKPPAEEIANDEVFLSKALTPVTYAQADLTQMVCNCMVPTLTSSLVSSKSYTTMKPYSSANVDIGRAAPWKLKS